MKWTVSLALLLVLPLCPGCSRGHAVEYEMTWSEGTQPGHVYFDFKDFPTHYVDIVSVDLRDYLESLGTHDVTVQFEVQTTFGCVESIRAVRIGERTDWPHRWGSSGWVNRKDPSPWDRFRCRLPWREN